MPLEITRESFDRMSAAEQSQVIAEGARIIDPGEKERQERGGLIANELARERRARTITRKQFEAMQTQAERDKAIRDGFRIID